MSDPKIHARHGSARFVQFSKLLHFIVTYPQTRLISHNMNIIILKVKKNNKKIICESNIPCLAGMELLEKYFIFIRPRFKNREIIYRVLPGIGY